jgi:hypothetical protein
MPLTPDIFVDLGMDSGKKGRSYLKWTDQMDKAMLDVFVDYYNKGDRAQNGWKPHVYTAAVKNSTIYSMSNMRLS